MDECRAVVQALDLYLGLPSLLLDGDEDRRLLYGKAGAFRPKSYGVEYRVLSNFWVLNPELREYVFQQTERALKMLRRKEQKLHINTIVVRNTINASDQNYAKKIIRDYNIPMPVGFDRKELAMRGIAMRGYV
jgi:hypothetical protein